MCASAAHLTTRLRTGLLRSDGPIYRIFTMPPPGFDDTVPRPPGLEIDAIRRAIDYVESTLAEFWEIYLEQANVFSALVGIFGTKALDSLSSYEKNRHPDVAQQRFPDLLRRAKTEIPT
jgi:hypothetical protein